eukprot:6660654-Pyramimonas_sp.AAC.2
MWHNRGSMRKCGQIGSTPLLPLLPHALARRACLPKESVPDVLDACARSTYGTTKLAPVSLNLCPPDETAPRARACNAQPCGEFRWAAHTWG